MDDLNYKEEQVSIPWATRDMVLAVVLIVSGFAVILTMLEIALVLGKVTGKVIGEDTTGLTPWIIGLLETLMLIAVWIFAIRRYRVRWSALGFRDPVIPPWCSIGWLPSPFISLAIMPCITLLGSLILTALYTIIVTSLGVTILEPPFVTDELLGKGLSRMLTFAILGVWGPFTEEVFFRGFLLAGLVVFLGNIRGVVVCSIIFAVAHLNLGALIPIFCTGVLLSWLYLQTRSLWPPILAHAAQNLIALTLAPLPQ